MKFLRRQNRNDYIADQDVTIGVGGGTDTVENVPLQPDAALEVEIEGRRYVLLAYEPKD